MAVLLVDCCIVVVEATLFILDDCSVNEFILVGCGGVVLEVVLVFVVLTTFDVILMVVFDDDSVSDSGI